jgi:hypothetical protein
MTLVATNNGGVKSKAQAVREYIAQHPKAKPADVVAALAGEQVTVTPAYVRDVTRTKRAKKPSRNKSSAAASPSKSAKAPGSSTAKFPRHSLDRVLRIPRGDTGSTCRQGVHHRRVCALRGSEERVG